MPVVRDASLGDIPTMLPLLHEFHRESSFVAIPIEPQKFDAFLRACIEKSSHACLLYEAQDGRIDGVMIGYVTPYYFSNEIGAWDMVFYVRPERRGSLVGYRLWKAFRHWAEAKGAKFLWLGSAANIAPERVRRFYTGLGMQEVGALYRLPLPHRRRGG